MTYKIIRVYFSEVRDTCLIKEGLTLEEARAHCRRDDTRGDGWFDCYTEEK